MLFILERIDTTAGALCGYVFDIFHNLVYNALLEIL